MDTDAVILAVASPPGRSVRGIVRTSGAACFEMLSPHLDPPPGPTDAEAEPVRRLQRVVLRLPAGPLPALALLMPAARSYTGEPAIELQLPGNPILLDRVIDALLVSARERDLDARRAEAGEFTARAFLNGRMSLTEAEGVAAVIAARSDAELRAARLLGTGKLAAFARGLADELSAVLALVEAGIDFADEEDVVPIAPADLADRVGDLHRRLQQQLARAVGMEQLEAIPWAVLTGPPNAGKSTLFNALLGRERAVVSGVAGTTRDVLAEPLSIETGHGPAEVMLVDVAGADRAESAPLAAGAQTLACAARDRAELTLCCAPVGGPAPTVPAGTLLVRTKADRGPAGDGGDRAADEIVVSARTGRGVEDLRRRIGAALRDRAVSLAADAVALGPRHDAALRSASRSLAEALALVTTGLVDPARAARGLADPEIVAASLRLALDDLAGLSGAVTPDDVLGRVFATFCIGK